VAPDDEAALAGALAQAIDHPRSAPPRRGRAPRRAARFAWPALADRLCALFAECGAAADDAAVAAQDS
jgi:glycosyltransferase involved in cell wall biosynthesis